MCVQAIYFVTLSPEKEDNTRKEVPYPCTIICRLPMNLSGEALDPVSPLPNASATHQLDLKRNKFQTNPIHPYPFVLLFNSKKLKGAEKVKSVQEERFCKKIHIWAPVLTGRESRQNWNKIKSQTIQKNIKTKNCNVTQSF